MKKIWIQIFIVIIGIILSISAHNGVKKYFYKKHFQDINYTIAYNNFSNVSFNNNTVIPTTSVAVVEDMVIRTTEQPKITTKESVTKTKTTLTTTSKIITKKTTTLTTTTSKKIEETKETTAIENKIEKEKTDIVYDGLTLNELTNKLNKNLKSTLTNTGHYFANYYIETGLDPYLAVAIVLQETGCKWTCSKLVRNCNNIGGMKGSPGCDGGAYKKYDTLEKGIYGYLDMLYNNYYSKGLTTPELINPKYATSKTWSINVNKYIENIKAS